MKTLRRWAWPVGVLAAVTLTAACDETPVQPALEPGTWVLESVDGAPLPVTLSEPPAPALRLLADTLYVEGADRFRRVRVLEDHAGVAPTQVRSEEHGVVRRSGGVRWLDLGCGDDGVLALCVQPDRIRAAGAYLELESAFPPGSLYRFRRR